MTSRVNTLLLTVFLLFFALKSSLLAQHTHVIDAASVGAYTFLENDAAHPCISNEEYQFIETELAENCRRLNIGNGSENRIMTTQLGWPLKTATGFSACNYHFIGAYVDQNTAASAIKDFNCGTNTYDGHKGTDLSIYPFAFYKMDNNHIEVIAAASGTIIAKSDGNFDRNCSSNNLTANYVIIQHADNSRALYWHMKKNSVTTKSVGQTVVAGEYLGVVGSSGSSSGPHLHFEVWTGSTSATYIDPYSGPCNTLNAASWWTTQRPHVDPAILKVSVNTTDIVVPGCPTTETPNESSSFTIPFQGAGLPAGYAKFYFFLRDAAVGSTIDVKILNPNGTTFNSWTHNISTYYKASYYGWSKLLPTTAGTYTFRATYNGNTCSQSFDIITNAPATITASGPTTFCQGDSVILTANAGSSYFWNNGATTRSITVKANGSFSVKVTYANGSSSTSSATNVTVNSLPTATITASGSATFCQGDSVVLTSSSGSSYLWNNGATTRSITVKSNGGFSVKVTGANGCSATSPTTNVTVNSLPTATITASGSATFCQGDSVVLTSSSGSSYLWNNGATTRSITVKSNGGFSVKVTGANGCSATSAVTNVTVNSLPAATITASGSATFCQGDSVVLTSSSGSSYLWNNGLTTRSITVKNSGNFSVKVTAANGCFATSAVKSVVVNAPQNGLPVVFRNDTLYTPYGAKNYWYLAGNTSPIDSGLFYKCRQSGNHFAKGKDVNGCVATSAVLLVNCTLTAVSANSNLHSIEIYPNPASSLLNVVINGIKSGEYDFVLMNDLGQPVFYEKESISGRDFHKTISTAVLPDGIYFLFITAENFRRAIKFTKFSQ